MKLLSLYHIFVVVIAASSIALAEECEDDRDWWFEANVSEGSNPKRSCNAIKKDIEDRCPNRTGVDGRLAWEACRETCGTCDQDWDYGDNSDEDSKELQSEPTFELAADGEDAAKTDNVEKQSSGSSPSPFFTGEVTATFIATAVSVAASLHL